MKKLDFPDRISVELTNDCNLKCVFCNRQKIKMQIGYMTKNLFFKIIDEAAEHLPVKLVPFHRGEPLMHPLIIEYLKYAKEKGIGPIQLATNALLLDEEKQDGLIEAGVDYLSFSLDTNQEEIYKRNRLNGDLHKSIENVRTFAEKCKLRRKKGLFAPTTQVSTINIDEYRQGYGEFVDYWSKYVDVVRVYEQHDEKGRLVDPVLRKELDFIEKRQPCRKIFTDMLIYWNGKVTLCNYDWDEKREFGDVSKTSLIKAWNSPAMEEIRDLHNRGIIDSGICKDCHHWKIDYLDNGYIGKSFVHGHLEKRRMKEE